MFRSTKLKGGMDRAKSCDSTTTTRALTRDDSLKHLSAEEKACLKFLEETIKSLDTVEDSSLSSNDTPSLSASGNRASKISKAVPSHFDADSREFHSKAHGTKNYLVPTPFQLANTSAHKLGITADKNTPPLNVAKASKSEKSHFNSQALPTEVNVLPSPPSTKKHVSSPKNGHLSDCTAPPDPLSFDGLVKPCKGASMKTEMPSTKVDLIDPKHEETPKEQIPESQCTKPNPPAVAPKPKTIPAHKNVLKQKAVNRSNTDSNMNSLSTSPGNMMGLMTQDKVRLEALTKLGLLKEDDLKSSTKQGLDTQVSTLPHPHSNATSQSSGTLSSTISENQKQLDPGLCMVMVPNMGEDRHEALRKLGLLKD